MNRVRRPVRRGIRTEPHRHRRSRLGRKHSQQRRKVQEKKLPEGLLLEIRGWGAWSVPLGDAAAARRGASPCRTGGGVGGRFSRAAGAGSIGRRSRNAHRRIATGHRGAPPLDQSGNGRQEEAEGKDEPGRESHVALVSTSMRNQRFEGSYSYRRFISPDEVCVQRPNHSGAITTPSSPHRGWSWTGPEPACTQASRRPAAAPPTPAGAKSAS